MRIFFYANISFYDSSSGISQKVKSQIKALKEMGNEVWLSSYAENGIMIFDNDDNVVFEKDYRISRYLFWIFRRFFLISNVRKFIGRCSIKFDISYLRFHYFDFFYLRLLKRMKKRSYVIVEAHGYPFRTYKIFSWIFWFVELPDIFFEPLCRKYIDLVAVVGNYSDVWKCKTVAIDNAVDLNKIKVQEKIIDSGRIRMVSVAIEQNYHGFEKLIRGMYEYYQKDGKADIKITMVGEYHKRTMKLVDSLGLEERITFVGKKYGEVMTDIYNHSDIAIGTFSIRANDEYGSSIKTKEYFAKGIPIINGWREYAFDDSYPYVRRFDLNEEIIDINQVIEFYDSIKENKQMQMEMRKFAEDHYSWEKQFKKIFDCYNKQIMEF